MQDVASQKLVECRISVLETLVYNHHHIQKAVNNTDVRIVHGYVYVVEASHTFDFFLCIVMFIRIYLKERKEYLPVL